MAEQREHERRIVQEEVVQTPQGANASVLDQRTRIEPTPAEVAWGNIRRAQQVVWFLFAVLCGLIGIRFLLVVLGANMTLGFGRLVYGITEPFVRPFLVLFGEQGRALRPGNNVEFGCLIAIVVYLLVAWAITKLIELLLAPRTARP